MFKDQFGNSLTVGDVVVYSQCRYGGAGVPTLAKITKMVMQQDWRGKDASYMSVEPLEKHYSGKKQLGYKRPLKKPSRVIKVDPSLLEQALKSDD